MTPAQSISTGVILLSVVAIAYGGSFLLKVTGGSVVTNELQRSYYRAGHAHAGVLVILGLVVQLLLLQVPVPAWSAALSSGVLYAAILMPAGFFLSVLGVDPAKPNALRYLIGLGGVSLTVGLVGSGAGLILAGTG